MICGSCGKAIPDDAGFCPFCGAAARSAGVEIPVAETPAAAENKKKKDRPEKKPLFKRKGATRPEVQTAFIDSNSRLTVGAAMFTAFFALDCVPYLIKAGTLAAAKKPLALVFVLLCDLIGTALAALVLFAASKVMTGQKRLPSAVFLFGLITALRFSQDILLGDLPAGTYLKTFVLIGAALAVGLLAAVLLLSPLKRLFSDYESVRQGGVLVALILIILALAAPSAMGAATVFLPFKLPVSFMSTFAGKLTADLLQAGLLTLAIKRLIKKQTPVTGKKALPSAVRLIAGAALAAAVFVGGLIGNAAYSVSRTVLGDVLSCTINGSVFTANGDMTLALKSYETAGEHIKAWSTLANGESYSVPSEYSGDAVLEYLSYLDDGADSLSLRLVNTFDPDETELWCPLMLVKYSEKDELTENEQEHRREVIGLCAAYDCFTYSYPTLNDITKNGEDIRGVLGDGNGFQKELRIAKAFSGVQRGELDAANAVNDILELAEEYPTDINLQYCAAVVGAENHWDNAGHYDKTAEAVMRFHSLWENERGGECDDEEYVRIKSGCADMLINVEKFDLAIPMLEQVTARMPSDKDAKQKLANCYLEKGDNEKNFTLISELYKDYPEDVTVIHSYFVGTLKKGMDKEAIGAASKLADIVKNDTSEGQIDGDTLLFNAATYLAMNDSSSYTDFQYKLYSTETSDEPVREIMKDEFLNDYVAAIFYDKDQRDYDKALEYVDKALEFQGNSARLWYLKGVILFDLKRFEESEKALLKADELMPDDMSTMYALANTYDAMGRYEEAYKLCKRVVNKYPNGADHDEDLYGVAPHARSMMGSLRQYVKEEDL